MRLSIVPSFLLFSSAFGQVPVLIQAIPATEKAYFKVVGPNCQPGSYSTPATLSWTAGPDCTVQALPPPDTGLPSRSNFYAWDDQNTAKTRVIPVPAAATTRSLRLRTEHRLSVVVTPAGAASIFGDGWHPENTRVRIEAHPAPGYVFVSWNNFSYANGGDDPPWVEVSMPYPITATATLRASNTPPLPVKFAVTRLPVLDDVIPGSFNQNGAIVGAQNQGLASGLQPVIWTPDAPNSPFGALRFLDGLAIWDKPARPHLNDEGRILNVAKDTTSAAIWTPLTPGSEKGLATAIIDPASVINGRTVGFNRYGQILGQTALWTPDSPGAISGSFYANSKFGFPKALNNYGQVLSTAWADAEGVAFRLFTPTSPNTGAGVFTEVPLPADSSVNQVTALSPLGTVAGVWCTRLPDTTCPMNGYIWQPDQPNGSVGQLTQLVAPAGFGGFAKIAGVNSAGSLVATLFHPQGDAPMVRLNGQFYDLMQVPGVKNGFQPIAINDAGQILMNDGYSAVLLLTPRPLSPTPPADAVPVTIDSSVPGAAFNVTGAGCQPGPYFSPRTLSWTPGATCQVQWSSPLSLTAGHRLRFIGWTDGFAANARTLSTPATAESYTATFTEEIEVILRVEPANAGTVSGGGWVTLGSTVNVSATANPGYQFQRWAGPGGPNTNAPAQFTPTYPTIYTAIYSVLTTPPYSYTVTKLTGMSRGRIRLNNYGQVLLSPQYGSDPAFLWTPDQPNSATGSSTTLAAYPTGSWHLDDYGRIGIAVSGSPLTRWTPSSPNARQGSYSTLTAVPSHPVSWIRTMNSYGQFFGGYIFGNATPSGIWTPESPNSSTGSVVGFLDYNQSIKAANDYGQFVMNTDYLPTQGFRLFTPSPANSNSGTVELIRAVPPADGVDAVALNRGGAIAFNVRTKGVSPTYTPEDLAYIWKPTLNNATTGQAVPVVPPTGFSIVQIAHMNNAGDVAGRVLRNGDTFVPFVVDEGRFFIVEKMAGLTDPLVIHAMNDAGQLIVQRNSWDDFALLTPNLTSGACAVSVIRTLEQTGPSGGRLTIAIAANPACQWTASSAAPWLKIAGPSTGTGSGTLQIDVPSNDSGGARRADIIVNGTVVSVRQSLLPSVSVFPSSLQFVLTPTGIAGPRQLQLRVNGPGAVTWRLAALSPNLKVDRTSGAAPDQVLLAYNPARGLPAPQILVQFELTGADQPTVTLPVNFVVQPATTPPASPFGVFETPVDKTAGVSGNIAVTGWALDDIGVKQVTIWRDPIGSEPKHANGYVYIGDSLFVPGARPDVEARFSTYPNADRAGWGYLMLTNALPGSGNGTFKIHAIATDYEGRSVLLGTKTITVDNLHSTKPFGAVDNPSPGQTISGTIVNDGWALTPQPASIADDGSTVWVNIDGVNVGHPLFGLYRSDVSTLFPGYANSGSSLGRFPLNSANYSNGMHSIAWIVSDTQGHQDGIGSRFFHTLNASVTATGGPDVHAERAYTLSTARAHRSAALASAYPAYRKGYDLKAALTPIRQAGDGLLETIELNELERLELHLPAGHQWKAALRVGDELRDLPIGSTLDTEGGLFYWQLGPGFLGEFPLEFEAQDGTTLLIPVRVGPTPATPPFAISEK